jgi:hypothetical protein
MQRNRSTKRTIKPPTFFLHTDVISEGRKMSELAVLKCKASLRSCFQSLCVNSEQERCYSSYISTGARNSFEIVLRIYRHGQWITTICYMKLHSKPSVSYNFGKQSYMWVRRIDAAMGRTSTHSTDQNSSSPAMFSKWRIIIIISGTTARIGPWPPLTGFRDG